VGIALYPEDARSPDELLKYADIAMYKAKAAGKNNYVFYNKNMQDAVQQRMLLGNYLRTALEKNEFELHYQPQLDIVSGKITGFEALLRWNSAQLGVVQPSTFIGIAEETRQIISIGDWVLRESCRFLRELKDSGYNDLTISVNTSVLQLLQNNYEDTVLEILHLNDIDPVDLELEITESILVESFDDIVAKLNRLRQEGIRIAMDDFGKGYSSLSGLKQLPIDTLKIDKIFIDSIGTDENESSITDSIVAMGIKLGKTVLAEGVETKCQMEYLTKHKCHKIQGFIVSRPVPEEKVTELLADKL
jgi:EAL domain-containing protein (putative c-di-GMP-specific phosphodiesterase class I)